MHHEMHFVDSLVNMPVATEPIFVRLRERLMTEHGSDASNRAEEAANLHPLIISYIHDVPNAIRLKRLAGKG